MILSGRDLQLYISTGRLSIEPARPEQFQQNGFDSVIERVEWKNTLFGLGHTREVFRLPDDLMAFVGVRSSWARRGFLVPPTIVDAGFQGDLTIEIARLGDADLTCGERFLHLIFARTTGPCVPYRGKYQGQRGITEAKE